MDIIILIADIAQQAFRSCPFPCHSLGIGGIMIALIIFICGAIGTGFSLTRAWSIFALFTLSFGYPLTWLGIIVVWMARLLLLG